MSQFKYFAGIDIAKKTFDIEILDLEGKKLISFKPNNTMSGLSNLGKKMKKVLGQDWKTSTLFCLEHTGIYCRPFLAFADQHGLNVWIQHALEIKRRSGMTRGKSDPVDAARIAEYAFRYRDKAVLWMDEGETIKELRTLISSRNRLLKIKSQLNFLKSTFGNIFTFPLVYHIFINILPF